MSAAAFAARRKRPAMTQAESSRQLRRATLGVRMVEVDAAVGQRVDEWVDAQLALPVTPDEMYTSMITSKYPGFPEGPDLGGGTVSSNQYLNLKLFQPERLRTRLVYALLEFFSVGGFAGNIVDGVAHAVLFDTLESASVGGTFREMLESVTRTPVMSRWLTYYGNAKTDGVRQPDENYARELMQLYTIGLWELNLDGSRKLTGELDPSDPRYVLDGTDHVPTYGQDDITNMARVFTGLISQVSYDAGVTLQSPDASFFGLTPGSPEHYDTEGRQGWASRLVFAPSHHESSLPKVALQGRVNIPVATGGDASLTAALDALVDHPSMAPYFAGRMIRLLITSNPSPAYIARVASVFLDDGQGVTGNLAKVFRAILLDQEALAPMSKGLTCRVPAFEEQMFSLVLSHRPFETVEGVPVAGGYYDYPGDPGPDFGVVGMGFAGPYQIFQNPSVFGRWPAAYAAAGPVFNAGLLSPELASLTEGQVSALLNQQGFFQRIGNAASAQDRADVMTTGDRPAVIERLSMLLTGGTAPTEFKAALLGWLDTRGLYFDSEEETISSNYKPLVSALWLSPWGIARR